MGVVVMGMTGIDLDAMPPTRVYTTYEVRSLCFRWYLRGARDWRNGHRGTDERVRGCPLGSMTAEVTRLKAERDDARATLKAANLLAETQAEELSALRRLVGQWEAYGRKGQ